MSPTTKAAEKAGTHDRSGADGPEVEISVRGLTKAFGDNEVLRGIDLDVGRGEVVCVIGPSGSGKSTLLRCVNLLEEPSGGTVRVGDAELTDPEVDIDRVRRRIGMVFQQFNLFPHVDVTGNLTLPQRRVLGAARPSRWRSPAGIWNGWASRTRRTPSPPSCPAGSSSASRSHGRW